MGNQIKPENKEKHRKRRSIARPSELGERVTALENTAAAQHSEIMRMLSEMSVSMKEGFKSLTDDVKTQALKQVSQDGKIEAAYKEINRIDSKLNKIMGGIGAVALTIVGGIFTLVAKYLGR